MRVLLSVLLCAALLGGCASNDPRDYKNTEPRFELREFFEGQVRAWGIFQDRSGEIRRRFTVDIEGRMEGDTLVLDEHFEYADGETDRRVWRIERVDEHRWRGTAGDVVGEARGDQYGFAFNWQYHVNLDIGDDIWQFHFDDWMYRIDDNTVINRAEVSKWGFTVGEVTLFFRREAAP